MGCEGEKRGALGQAEEHARLKGKTKEIQEELEAFWQAPPSGSNVTAQAFWGEPGEGMAAGAGKRAYPNLWKAARHFLCFSASNGDLERFFSAAQQLLEQKRRRGRMGQDTPQKLLLLKANGAALGLPDYWEVEKPKKANSRNAQEKAGHSEPVEEEQEEGDETAEDEEEEGEENDAGDEFAGAEEESVEMEKGDPQESRKITSRKNGVLQIARGPVVMTRAELRAAQEKDDQSDEDYEAQQQEKRARLLRGPAAQACVSATGARASSDIPPKQSCLGGR